jgi:hypothetical protein
MIGAYWGGAPLAGPDSKARRQNDATVSREAGAEYMRFGKDPLLVIGSRRDITVQIRPLLVDHSQHAVRKRRSAPIRDGGTIGLGLYPVAAVNGEQVYGI